MKRTLIALSFVFLIMSAMSCSKTKPKEEWVNVMPGPNLEGWTIVDIPADGPLSETPQWSLDKSTGNVVCNGTGGRDWLRYDRKEFSDFIFHAEWRFKKIEEPAKYNSGVFVRNSAEFKIWHQAQMGSASGGYLFGNSLVNGEEKRVSTKDQIKDMANPVKPAGEWNSYDITCKGQTISLVVNGVKTTVWKNCEVLKGYIGLEAEGYYVEFRNLKVKEL